MSGAFGTYGGEETCLGLGGRIILERTFGFRNVQGIS